MILVGRLVLRRAISNAVALLRRARTPGGSGHRDPPSRCRCGMIKRRIFYSFHYAADS